jgi:hypothetical protein
MNITEKDAETLDYIVLESLKTICLHARDLRSLENGFLSNNEDVKESAYTYYFDILKDKKVVRVEKGFNNKTEIYSIDIKTKEFLRQGGFKKEIQDELNAIEKAGNIEKLKTKNLELQNENLEFAQTIREQESKIRDLELKIKGIELIKQYWWFIGLCILIGGILKEPLGILITYMRQ